MNAWKTLLLVSVAVAAIGCDASMDVSRSCTTNAGAVVFVTRGSFEMTCKQVQATEDSARETIVGRGFTDYGTFNTVSGQATIWVHSDVTLSGGFSGAMASSNGYNQRTLNGRDIHLAQGAETWAHELLHSVDVAQGASDADTAQHLHWDTRGGTGEWFDFNGDGFGKVQFGSWVSVGFDEEMWRHEEMKAAGAAE